MSRLKDYKWYIWLWIIAVCAGATLFVVVLGERATSIVIPFVILNCVMIALIVGPHKEVPRGSK